MNIEIEQGGEMKEDIMWWILLLPRGFFIVARAVASFPSYANCYIVHQALGYHVYNPISERDVCQKCGRTFFLE